MGTFFRQAGRGLGRRRCRRLTQADAGTADPAVMPDCPEPHPHRPATGRPAPPPTHRIPAGTRRSGSARSCPGRHVEMRAATLRAPRARQIPGGERTIERTGGVPDPPRTCQCGPFSTVRAWSACQGAPGRNRTYGLPLRRRSLYPLSYWGGRGGQRSLGPAGADRTTTTGPDAGRPDNTRPGPRARRAGRPPAGRWSTRRTADLSAAGRSAVTGGRPTVSRTAGPSRRAPCTSDRWETGKGPAPARTCSRTAP